MVVKVVGLGATVVSGVVGFDVVVAFDVGGSGAGGELAIGSTHARTRAKIDTAQDVYGLTCCRRFKPPVH